MNESYVDGNLGVVFNSAVPLTLPVVSQLLRERRDTSDDVDGTRVSIRSCKDQVDMMQETCADEETVSALRRRYLRLRRGEVGPNAHLAHLQVDADGNILSSVDPDSAAVGATTTKEKMKPFEVVALATLMPRTAEEAMLLIPSLARFELADMQEEVITLLEQ